MSGPRRRPKEPEPSVLYAVNSMKRCSTCGKVITGHEPIRMRRVWWCVSCFREWGMRYLVPRRREGA